MRMVKKSAKRPTIRSAELIQVPGRPKLGRITDHEGGRHNDDQVRRESVCDAGVAIHNLEGQPE